MCKKNQVELADGNGKMSFAKKCKFFWEISLFPEVGTSQAFK